MGAEVRVKSSTEQVEAILTDFRRIGRRIQEVGRTDLMGTLEDRMYRQRLVESAHTLAALLEAFIRYAERGEA